MVGKLLVVNREITPSRITVIIVKENMGTRLVQKGIKSLLKLAGALIAWLICSKCIIFETDEAHK